MGPHLYTAVTDEQFDLALLAVDRTPPELLKEQIMSNLRRYTFMLNGHHATENWNKQARLDGPQVMVGMSNAVRQTLEDRVVRNGFERRIEAHLPEFSGVVPLFARTIRPGTRWLRSVVVEISEINHQRSRIV